MEYGVGRAGRVIVARLFEGENPYECIEAIAQKESVRAAVVTIVGGFRQADVVVGPKEEKPKIVGDVRHFEGPGEVLGVGTVYWDEDGPKLHLHGTMGKGKDVMVGCPRMGASVFLVLEVTMIEITGLEAQRRLDPDSGVKLLRISGSC